MTQCGYAKIPTRGWICKRTYGHESPCALVPDGREPEPARPMQHVRMAEVWSAHCLSTAEARAHDAFAAVQQLKRENAQLLQDAIDMAQYMRLNCDQLRLPMRTQYTMQRYHPDLMRHAKRAP